MDQQLYTCDFTKSSGTVSLYKYDIPLPKKPPIETFRNYGLPKAQQKFHRDVIPKTILKRKSILTKEEEAFICGQYHKRVHGEWWLIGGQEVYFPGNYWWFLNYHTTKDGVKPQFRYIQLLVWLFRNWVARDTKCYGFFLVGARRGGKTEITLGMLEEYCTRVKRVHGGMQSKNDTAAEENFDRVALSQKEMIWYMKAICKSGDMPDEKLDFSYPTRQLTDKRLRDLAESGEEEENPYSEEEMGSWIDYGPSIAGHYDRTELNFWIMNEAGKLEKMSLLKCWEVVKPCLHYNAGKNIVGKAIFETTIEEIDDKQIGEINILIRDSDYDDRDENGQTTSGLYVLFLSIYDMYDEDEFGFPLRDECEQFINNKLEHLKKKKKYKDITEFLRKHPRTLEEAITPSGSQSAFNKERLQDIIKRLDFPEDYGFEKKDWGERGNFIWANGKFDSQVIFIPDPKGKFFATELLKDGEDNAQMSVGGIRYPMNVTKYRGGVDPFDFDLKEVIDKNRASLGGGVMMRLYDDMVDGAKINDGAPIDFGWEWETKQPVCTYLAREDDSKIFFEDMLMMHVYYGTQMNVENNKKVIKNHFKDRGYAEYIMPRPESTMNESQYDVNKSVLGTPASTDTIEQYFHAITHYVMVYCNAIKHRDLVLQLLEMNKNNRSKMDLGVAFGMALIACEKKYYKMPNEYGQDENQKWFAYEENIEIYE